MVDLDTLESVAQQLAARVRDDDPQRVWAWLEQELPDPADWFRLCFALAAAVPDDQTWRQLTDWTQYGPETREERRRRYQREWVAQTRARTHHAAA